MHFGVNASEKIITFTDLGERVKGPVLEVYAPQNFRFCLHIDTCEHIFMDFGLNASEKIFSPNRNFWKAYRSKTDPLARSPRSVNVIIFSDAFTPKSIKNVFACVDI